VDAETATIHALKEGGDELQREKKSPLERVGNWGGGKGVIASAVNFGKGVIMGGGRQSRRVDRKR